MKKQITINRLFVDGKMMMQWKGKKTPKWIKKIIALRGIYVETEQLEA